MTHNSYSICIAILFAFIGIHINAAEVRPQSPAEARGNGGSLIISNIDKFNRGDLDGFAADYAESLSNHGATVPRAAIRQIGEDIRRTFPDAVFELIDLVSVGEFVVVRMTFKGTHRGKGKLPVNGGMLVGVEPTGKGFAVEHIHWFRVRGNKIVEHHASRDDIGMMRQLGLIASPDPAQSVPAN